MIKNRPILTLLLILALLMQGYDTVSAKDSDCCPDDCSQDSAFCLMMTTGGNCATCQTAAMSPYALNASANAENIVTMRRRAIKIHSTEMNNIWRPPIAA